jgi:hypothetical protein
LEKPQLKMNSVVHHPLAKNKSNFRDLGMAYAQKQDWSTALFYLNLAVRQLSMSSVQNLVQDITLLDFFGEAAYRQETPEVLSPYQNYFKYPKIAVHMARAFLMLGDVKSCHEFLNYAQESALKSAVFALSEMSSEITKTSEILLPVAVKHPDLYYPEYWRALAAVADAVQNYELVELAELKSKQWAYSDPNIHFNQALRMLGRGEFNAAWRLYEWRLVPGASQSNRTELGTISMWEGEELKAGKSLLIFLEQGLGDCIFALRYIEHFLKQNIKIQIVARSGLIDIIKQSFKNVIVLNEDDVAEHNYWRDQHPHPKPDYWVYAMSIPYRANLLQPHNCSAYLELSNQSVEKIKNKLSQLNPQNLPVYCMNWHGRIDTEADQTRAFGVKDFYLESHLDQKKCVVVSLQKEAKPEEINTLTELVKKNNSIFINAADLILSFNDTASWIVNSEHLFTNDTSVAHLGGALGHPTTVLVKNKAIWQWLRKDYLKPLQINKEPDQSLWYESVQLQYSSTNEKSWLFTTTKKDHPLKNQGDFNESNPKTDQLQQDQLQPDLPKSNEHWRSRRKILFAGRT